MVPAQTLVDEVCAGTALLERLLLYRAEIGGRLIGA